MYLSDIKSILAMPASDQQCYIENSASDQQCYIENSASDQKWLQATSNAFDVNSFFSV